MNKLTEIGRIVFAIPILIFGFNHFINWQALADIYPHKDYIGVYSMLLTGAGLIAVSISIILKKYIKISCLLLAFMLLIFIVSIHIPELFSDTKATHSMAHMLKDLGLMGGALMIAGLYPDKK